MAMLQAKSRRSAHEAAHRKQAYSASVGGARSRRWVPRRLSRASETRGRGGRIPPSRRNKLGRYLRELRKLYEKYGYNPSHLRSFRARLHSLPRTISISRPSRESQKCRSFMEEATDLCVKHDGSLSGEHGDGQSRARVPEQDVRRGVDSGVPRVQVDLGSGLEDESGQDRRSLPH